MQIHSIDSLFLTLLYNYISVYLVVERGVDPYLIDKLLEGFGFPMGVFKMNDLSGLDVGLFVGGIIAKAYQDRVYRSTLVPRLVEGKRLGRTTSCSNELSLPNSISPLLLYKRTKERKWVL